MRRARALGLVLGTLLASAACEPIEPASILERPRILGAKIVLPGDPGRASPRPGEDVVLEVISASRDVARGAFSSSSFVLCEAVDDPIEARCAGPRVATARATGPDDPRVPFLLPPGFGKRALVFAMLCVDGGAEIDPSSLRGSCAGGTGQEMAVRFDVGSAANLHPVLGDDAITIDGARAPSGSGGCDGGAIRVRADGLTHPIVIAVANLEEGEDPLVSHVVTRGELEGLYSSRRDDGTFRVGWEVRPDFAGTRIDARLHVVVRDGRGGTASRIVDACLEKGS